VPQAVGKSPICSLPFSLRAAVQHRLSRSGHVSGSGTRPCETHSSADNRDRSLRVIVVHTTVASRRRRACERHSALIPGAPWVRPTLSGSEAARIAFPTRTGSRQTRMTHGLPAHRLTGSPPYRLTVRKPLSFAVKITPLNSTVSPAARAARAAATGNATALPLAASTPTTSACNGRRGSISPMGKRGHRHHARPADRKDISDRDHHPSRQWWSRGDRPSMHPS
jgi:hypothetical protein